jgi:pilus assembly protein Flp/PilA
MGIRVVVLCSELRKLLVREDGQDLVEYALIVALIALGATAGMNTVANDIGNAFTDLGEAFSANF